MFTIKIKRKALKALAKTDRKQKQKIKSVVLILKNDPIPFKTADVCKLKGCDNTYRIRVGATRIVYEVLWDEKTILIHYVGLREKAYK
jgi:mRNA-degrading endonuclease RelE of RelBE toxin-antitoxin system